MVLLHLDGRVWPVGFPRSHFQVVAHVGRSLSYRPAFWDRLLMTCETGVSEPTDEDRRHSYLGWASGLIPRDDAPSSEFSLGGVCSSTMSRRPNVTCSHGGDGAWAKVLSGSSDILLRSNDLKCLVRMMQRARKFQSLGQKQA